MAQATQDLVIRMKTDSQNFNDGIEKAKGKIKSFSTEGQGAMGKFSGAIGVATKAFGALGLAVGAKNMFTSFINSTESMSDTFNNEMGAMKDGWKDFLWQVNTSNFSGFDTLISKARKAREELDALGDASSLFDLSSNKLTTEMDDLLNKMQKKKKKGEDYSEELNAYNELLAEYKKSGNLKKDKTLSSLRALFDRKGFNLEDMGLGGKGIEGYFDLAITAREAAAGVYDDVIKQYREARDKTATGDLKQEGDWVYSEPHDYLGELQKEKGFAWVERARILSDLADITTEEKNQIDELIKQYYATDRAIIQQDRRLNKMLETETSKETKTTIPQERQPVEQMLEYERKAFQNEILNNDRIKDSQLIEIEVLDEEIVEPELDALLEKIAQLKIAWEKQIEVVNAYADTLGYMASMFSSLSSIASDSSPWKKFLNVLSSVSSNVGSLIKVYSSLVAVEAVAQAIQSGESWPFPYNLIIMAAAGAAIAGIIASVASQAKGQNYATGGIVGGHDYNDGITAHVSSGEMIINRQQQLSLWKLINGVGTNKKMDVEFVIRGEDLVGTINNYNTNNSY